MGKKKNTRGSRITDVISGSITMPNSQSIPITSKKYREGQICIHQKRDGTGAIAEQVRLDDTPSGRDKDGQPQLDRDVFTRKNGRVTGKGKNLPEHHVTYQNKQGHKYADGLEIKELHTRNESDNTANASIRIIPKVKEALLRKKKI